MADFRNDGVKSVLDVYFKLGENVLLVGPSGTGKTMVVRQMCRETKRNLIIVTGKESMQDLDMLGAYVATEEAGKFRWVDGPLTKAFKAAADGVPTVLLVDEINRMASKHQNIFIEAINIYDDDHYVVHNPQAGVSLKAPKDMIQFVATANAGQAGVNDIPLALVDRFNIVFVDYPERKAEMQILLDTGLDKDLAKSLVVFAEKTREMADQMDLACGISTRSLVQVANQFQRLAPRRASLQNRVNLLVTLMRSPVSQAAGACSNADMEWKERAAALFQQFGAILNNHLSAGSKVAPPEPTSAKRSTAGIGAAPAAI